MTVDSTAPDLRRTHTERHLEELVAFLDRHETILSRVGNIDEDLWEDRATDLIFANGKATATDFGRLVFNQLVGRSAGTSEVRFRPDFLDPWLQKTSRNIAAALIAGIVADVDEIGPDDTFSVLRSRAAELAVTLTTISSNFGAHDGARAAGAGSKTWQVTSDNPRSSHAALNGETVPLGQSFSNGLRWPGDRDGGVDETANCHCTLTFTRGR